MNRVKIVAMMAVMMAVALNGFAQTAFVTIGNAGNTNNTTGYGGVAYEYKIGAQEVTIAEFAASGAGDGDEDYWNDGTRAVGTHAPATFVSLYEAMKYCNWLTTGDTNRGYYSTRDGGTTYQANALAHDAYADVNGTTYFVPTLDEWYKAAYWTDNGYSIFVDGTSDYGNWPAESGGLTGWNYNNVNASSSPDFIRDTAHGTTEQNGTVNMMGNVEEWLDDSSGKTRGGYYLAKTGGTSTSASGNYSPTNELERIGFRPVKVVSAFVSIGDAGNADDTTGYGGVAYEYKISDHEVTIAEMALSGAGDGDEDYWNDGTRTVGTAAPAVYVSLYEAMKYCNWLTTGDINRGYYSTSDDGATYQANALTHDAYAAAYGTTYFVPTEDEWVKAAYWTGSGYSRYANGTSTIPTEGGGASGWNYHTVNTAPNYTRDTALGTPEQNGTVNMMGNVYEWMENPTGFYRGGGATALEWNLRSTTAHFAGDPSNENTSIGFRPIVVVSTFVRIGGVRNADDASGYGGVDYEYKISNSEVTIAEFSASGAGDGDENYWNDGTRTVGLGAPATFISLYEAMKYCNYLTTGNMNSGYYSSGDGGATYQANTLSHDAYAEANGLTYFVPTEDEWYKAAYWAGTGYSLYADGSSAIPTEGGGASGWNYNFVNSSPNYTRGTVLGTPEQNGTVNMMGNVYEWLENSAGVSRGGEAGNAENDLRSSVRYIDNSPSTENSAVGFRPVIVEPTFVSIGNVENANDTTGYGGVDYEYKISTREVSSADLAASGADEGTSEGTDAPAIGFSLYEAMRYCNWLTTGDANRGYYSSSDGGETYQTNALAHNVYAALHGTTYFVPTEDEWYKAAYYDASGADGYSLYADGTSDVNHPPAEGGGATGWNYNDVKPGPDEARCTALGTPEQNGTVNMMGNVSEWMEDSSGVYRGGHFDGSDHDLRSSYRDSWTPSSGLSRIGFRPVMVEAPMFVSIGDVGNADDTTGYGNVDYEYKIGAQEVTIAEFVLSGAGDGDEDYWNDAGMGTSVGSNAPATKVTLYEAMKYCNWLTTGDINNGYYSTTDGGATYQANALSHDAYAATYGFTAFVPTEDEWYKAAYWMGRSYSYYANGTNTIPTEGGGISGWNYNNANSSNHVRGTALGTTEQNGTVNMMGNVTEWMEDAAGVLRGGFFTSDAYFMSASYRDTNNGPVTESPAVGFRPVIVAPAPAAFVTIADAGNLNDSTGYGSVAYEYEISDREVSISEFALSGAGDGDEDYWNDDSTTSSGRTVGSGAPASRVSLYEAMKYCNWLTTGDINRGYYSSSDAGTTYQANALSHQAFVAAHGTTYFVPTEDEWYKAAYYDSSGSNGYSLYANGTNTIPTEGGGATGWNYNDVNFPAETRGTALGTPEQNGTVNMMGNVTEWMEDSAGVIRGGGSSVEEFYLSSAGRSANSDPSGESIYIGFRPVVVNPVPDPPVFLTIGRAGNSDFSSTGYGGVDYEYKISKREVSILEFALSGAGDGNEGFWNDDFSTESGRTAGPGAPATKVTLYEAMKYCNWLTTGDINNGYYSTSDEGVTYQANALSHDTYAAAHGPTYFVPTEDEWYKAAYYDASDLGHNGWSRFADGVDLPSHIPIEGCGTSGWNYNFVNSAPNYTRDTALGTTEQNGTVNMMGNVAEWMEDAAGVVRGGDYIDRVSALDYWTRSDGYDPAYYHDNIGFRPVNVVASARATAASLVMSGLDISWQSETGQSYSVLTTTNLVTAPWATVPGWPHSGTGGMLIYTNTYTNSPRFFKVDASVP